MLADSDHVLELETLAAMICNDKACYEGLCFPLVADHFTLESNRRLLKCIERTFKASSGQVTLGTLHSYLVECGLSEMMGWNTILHSVDRVPTWYVIYANMPRLDELRMRRAKRAAVEDAYKAMQAGDPDKADKVLDRIGEIKPKRKPKKSMQLQMDEVRSYLSGKSDGPLVTGWPSIDKRLKISRTRLYGIAGRTKEGKTTFALQLAIGVARSGGAVHVFSGEMSQPDCNILLLRTMAGVDLEHGCHERLSQEHQMLVDGMIAERSRLPIEIDDTNRTLPDVIREARRLRGKVALFVVDHSSIIKVPGMDKVRGVPELTMACKQILATECNAAVLLLTQYKQLDDKTRKPTIDDIFGGGALKQDADATCMVWRGSYDGDAKNEKAELLVAAMRHGRRCGSIPLRWNDKAGRYEDPAEMPI